MQKAKREARHAEQGLTLLELVIYIGTASIATLGVVALFTMLGNSWIRVQARARVEEGARLAVERMRFEIEGAQAILDPTPGSTSPTLSVDAGGSSRTYSGEAWSDHLGWMQFDCDDGDTPTWNDCDQSAIDASADPREVTSSFSRLSGWAATADTSLVLMNCANASGAGTCITADHAVSVDASGDYHGFAWSDGFGWISFNCENTSSCLGAAGTNPCGGVAGNWRVCEIWDAADNEYELHGWAWSEFAGWISFNCEDRSTCATSDYEVTAALSGSDLTFGVDTGTGQLFAREGMGANQYLTDDDVAINNCAGWGADYFRVVANPAPARAAVTLCFTATYVGAGSAITNYSTEVQTSFQLR